MYIFTRETFQKYLWAYSEKWEFVLKNSTSFADVVIVTLKKLTIQLIISLNV